MKWIEIVEILDAGREDENPIVFRVPVSDEADADKKLAKILAKELKGKKCKTERHL